MAPDIRRITDDATWVALLDEQCAGTADARTVIVYSPSAAAHVGRVAPERGRATHFQVTREPAVEDFAPLERAAIDAPDLVIGIGGGRALDAAKVVAHWGRAFSSVQALRGVLHDGGRPPGNRARLVLVPTLASSGSESSRGAIVSMDGQKTGLRGDSMQPDLVVHDPRMWEGMSDERRRHFAFDVLAHLLETTVSLRRSTTAAEHAAEGWALLSRWLTRDGLPASDYEDAMRAAYHAGICLGASSTCLPHRMQYVVGPLTDTSHVEGIWMLAPHWMRHLETTSPSRAAEAFELLGGGATGYTGLGQLYDAVHSRAGHSVRTERFRWTPAQARTMAAAVSGDLAADPAYVDVGTIEQIFLDSSV